MRVACAAHAFQSSRRGALEPPRLPSNPTPEARSGLEGGFSAAKRGAFHRGDEAIRVKLFSQGLTAPIKSLEDDINDFLESQRPHVTYVSVSSSDVERVASVWYEEPHHRTVEQTIAELEELAEEPRSEGNLA